MLELRFLDPSKELPRIKSIWCEFCASADVTYFLSWGWVENWLTCLPEDSRPQLAMICQDGSPVVIFFLKKNHFIRKRLFTSRGWFVNAIGKPVYDNIWIEYNRFLHLLSENISLRKIIALLPDPWDELLLPGLDTKSFPGDALENPLVGYNIVIQSRSPSPYVDLAEVRAKQGDYISLLSSNTRSQIRRSYRLYEARGPVILEVAETVNGALRIFEEMLKLHQYTWGARKIESPFASEFVIHFHKTLIQKRFDSGEIQLLRIRAGNSTVGCLYNFDYKGNVYFYQSGMDYEADRRLKPGFVAHVEAVKYNAMAGRRVYDFLGGIERYKTSLATHENSLVWVKIQKPRLRFLFENHLKLLKKLFQGRKSA